MATPTPSTLYDYYSSQGKPLPSVADRAPLYQSLGLGSAGAYFGTAEQNIALLGKLTSQGSQAAPQAIPAPTVTSSRTSPLPLVSVANPANPAAPSAPNYQMNAQELGMGQAGIDAFNKRIAGLIQSQADDLSNQPLPSSTPTRTSASIEADFQKYLDNLGAPPVVPDMATEQTNAENQVGIPGIQANINNLTGTLTNLENDLQNRQAQEASKPGVVATIINGRMQMLSAQDSKALNDLKAQITSANTQLTQANTAVATIMRNKQTDYANAHTAYNDAYTKAYNTFTNAETEIDKEQASASANAKVIIDSFKGTANKPSTNQQASFTTLELQAGLPSGFIEAAINAESTSGTKIDHWQTVGNTTYAYGTDANGKPVLLKSFSTPTSAGGGASTSEQKTIAAFNKSIAIPPKTTETREQYARRLQAAYPTINSDDILRKVYETYPDNYNAK